MERETPRSAAAFYEYCLLGADRSLAKLAQKYGKNTAYIRQLEKWSSTYNWQERVKQYDEEQAKIQEQAIAAEKAKILTQGYAQMHERVKELARLSQKLIDMTDDEEKVWLPDVKAIGTGPNARQVDLVRFNDALFSEIRGYLGDIASEMGERVKKSDVNMTGQVVVREVPNGYLGEPIDE